jgi:hypothetical protein
MRAIVVNLSTNHANKELLVGSDYCSRYFGYFDKGAVGKLAIRCDFNLVSKQLSQNYFLKQIKVKFIKAFLDLFAMVHLSDF